MPSHRIKCCVKNCAVTGVTIHRFPNPRTHMDLFKIWLDILGIEELNNMEPTDVYNRRRVCFAHFDIKCKSPGNSYLHKNAIPTFNLSLIAGIPQSSQNRSEPGSVIHFRDSPSTSQNRSEPGSVIHFRDSPCTSQNRSEPGPGIHLIDSPSTSQPVVIHETPGPSTDSVSNVALLKSVSTTRQKNLSPKAKSLYKSALYWKRAAYRSRLRKNSFQERLNAAETFSESEQFAEMTPTAQTFFEMQTRETKTKPRARRFTKNEKILCLTLYKNSPKNYGLLHKLFTLPSRKTLDDFLRHMTLKAGINKHLFYALKRNVNKLPPHHRICVLMFDEISIGSHLQYNENLDVVEGFVDDGINRKIEFADHALVFMVRGIVKQWKQPVAFTFCRGFTKSAELARLIKTVVGELQNIGLIVAATVCDQAKTNEAAINILKKSTAQEFLKRNEEWRDDFFEINDKQIIALFDIPHLLKGIRNNLLKKNMQCTINAEKLTGKWEHVQQLYNIDRNIAIEELRLLPKLTEFHVFPNTKQKMKVKYCSQVFSQRVASIMSHVAATGSHDLDETAVQTAKIFLFFDKLFDSLNGSTLHGVDGKPLTAAISNRSSHFKFWETAIVVLQSIKFEKDGSYKDVPPSVKNFIKTIRGVKLLWEQISKLNVQFLFARNLNQDPIENYFGLVRSQGVRNINPTCSSFIQTFKTLTINNFTAKHSIGSNCENDFSEGALSTLIELITDDTIPEERKLDTKNFIEPGITDISEDNFTIQKSNYCTGFILKSLHKLIKECAECKSDLQTIHEGIQHGIIKAREYDENMRLMYPSYSVTTCFITMKILTIDILKLNLEKPNLIQYVKQKILETVDFNFLLCDEHKTDVKEMLIKKCALFFMHYYVNEKNEIIKGKKNMSDIDINTLDIYQKEAKRINDKNKKFKL